MCLYDRLQTICLCDYSLPSVSDARKQTICIAIQQFVSRESGVSCYLSMTDIYNDNNFLPGSSKSLLKTSVGCSQFMTENMTVTTAFY